MERTLNQFAGAGPSGRRASRGTRHSSTRIDSAVLAMVLLLMAESMLFAGLLGASVLVRSRTAGSWPPADLPRLPWPLTLANTFALLATVPLVSTARAQRSRPLMFAAVALGAAFFVVQGCEWARMLLWRGEPGSYGAIFYSTIGIHALHVAGGLAALIWSACTIHHPNAALRLKVCGMYWYFVVAVWPVIYVLVCQ